MTEEQLAAIRERSERSVVALHDMWGERYDLDIDALETPLDYRAVVVDFGKLAVARHASDDVLELLAEVDQLKATVRGLKHALTTMAEYDEIDRQAKMMEARALADKN